MSRRLRGAFPAAWLLLAACRGSAPDCPTPRTVGWDPVVTSEVRLDESNAVWTSPDGALIDPAATEGCPSPPCVSVTGPGTAQAETILNRNTTNHLTATLVATAPARVQVLQETETSDFVELAAEDYPAGGPTAVDITFDDDQSGNRTMVVLDLPGGSALLDDVQITADTWAAVDDPPVAPMDLGFLIHIEQDVNFTSDKNRWNRRAHVIDALSKVFADHGAKLTVQPDASFIRGAQQWSPGWVQDRSVEGVGWSIHIHGEDEAGDLEHVVRDAKVAFHSVGVDVTDINGGFLTGQWGMMRDVGLVSLTAFKNFRTQGALPEENVQPWRPADGTGDPDPDAFATPDPDGPLLYLPGSSVKEWDHPRFPAFASRVLSQALAHTRTGFVNTWYFVLHIDSFGPEEGDEQALYFSDGSFEADVAEYDRMLTDVTDPLVAAGWLRYTTPEEMADDALAWEASCRSAP